MIFVNLCGFPVKVKGSQWVNQIEIHNQKESEDSGWKKKGGRNAEVKKEKKIEGKKETNNKKINGWNVYTITDKSKMHTSKEVRMKTAEPRKEAD